MNAESGDFIIMPGFCVTSERRSLEGNSWWMLYFFPCNLKKYILYLLKYYIYLDECFRQKTCMYVPSAYRGQKRMLHPPEPELLIVVKCHEVLETEPGSSGSAAVSV